MNWRTAHPKAEVPSQIDQLVTAGTLIDISWGNDTQPSFYHRDARSADGNRDVRLWVDYAEPTERECDRGTRYAVVDHNSETTILETDDLAAALTAFEAYARRIGGTR